MRFLTQPSTVQWRDHQWQWSPHLKQGLVFAVLIAIIWWGFALLLRSANLPILIWDDQLATFTVGNLARPYDQAGFVNPPWTMFFLWPFSLPPFEIAVLLQLIVLFVGIIGVIFKFGSPRSARLASLIVLTSPFALDNALQLNIDWIVVVSLLLPPAYCAPLLLTKPQNAIGYLLSFKWSEWVRWTWITLGLILLSFVLWGNWPLEWLENSNQKLVVWQINIAPNAFLGYPLAVILGVIVLFFALRRRDPVLSILAGICFVPYLASYSAILPFALITVRLPALAAVISVTIWFVVLGLVL
ncbi:MAG: hypothetical protein MUF87_01020 [Anaerolineae bacterium]|jgi:hypothetical protein|nr:hypothetical protein [Anaerolineae bacterium]